MNFQQTGSVRPSCIKIKPRLVRGSLRKFLDTHQLSTIIEILPLHFLKVLSLNIYATSHPPEPRLEALVPVTVIQCTELQPHLQVLKTTSQAVGPSVGNRKKSPRCQVWTARRMGQQLHRSLPQKIYCQMDDMGRGIVMVQQDAPQSSS